MDGDSQFALTVRLTGKVLLQYAIYAVRILPGIDTCITRSVIVYYNT